MSSHPQQIPLANFSMLLATNYEGILAGPLRQRFRMILRFQHYTSDELTALLRQRSRALGWPTTDDAISNIARLGRSTPRVALRWLESCWRICQSKRKGEIDGAIFREMIELEDIDRHWGLDRIERTYLRILADSDSPTRLQTLCRRLGIPRQSLVNITEDFLCRSGLIESSDLGRELTCLGRTCVEQIRDEQDPRA